ncbi:hypothetical protein [Rhizobium binxianense]
MAMTDKKGGSRKRTERRGNLITGYAGKWEPLFEKKQRPARLLRECFLAFPKVSYAPRTRAAPFA